MLEKQQGEPPPGSVQILRLPEALGATYEVGALVLRPFGVDKRDLDVDFNQPSRPALVTDILECCATAENDPGPIAICFGTCRLVAGSNVCCESLALVALSKHRSGCVVSIRHAAKPLRWMSQSKTSSKWKTTRQTRWRLTAMGRSSGYEDRTGPINFNGAGRNSKTSKRLLRRWCKR